MGCFFCSAFLPSALFSLSLPAGTILLAECWFVMLVGVGVAVIFGVWRLEIWG